MTRFPRWGLVLLIVLSVGSLGLTFKRGPGGSGGGGGAACSEVHYKARPAAAVGSNIGPTGVFAPFLMGSAVTTLTNMVNTDFVESSPSVNGIQYEPADLAGGRFACEYHGSIKSTASHSLYFSLAHGNLSCADTTELNGANIANSAANSWVVLSGSEEVDLVYEDRLCLVGSLFGSATTVSAFSLDLRCRQISTATAPCG